MLDDLDSILIHPDNSREYGLPLATPVYNSDLWPSPVAFEQTVDTAVAITMAGYEGIVVQPFKLEDGRICIKFLTDRETPEGRLVEKLLELARCGKRVGTSEALSILECDYCENGLLLPIPLSAKRGAC